MQLLLLTSSGLFAQVGIGTVEPDASSLLDIVSDSKGFLMPRLTTVQRDAIEEAATGLMIYNSTLNDGQINIGTPLIPKWLGIKGQEGPSPTILSVSKGDDTATSSLLPVLVNGMTLSPPTGAYLISFNGEIASVQNFDTSVGALDVVAIYNQAKTYPGGVAHTLVFGNGEILTPGVYDVTGAPSVAGVLTLDGGGDPNALFIIRGTGAFTTGSGADIILTNGTVPCNVFWLSEGAMSTGANTKIKGTLIANNAAIALGANTKITGSLFSTIGAITMGADSVLSACPSSSLINYYSLNSFAIFTASGGISSCPTCYVTGNVGTALGAATDFPHLTGSIFYPGVTPIINSSTYSLYKNEVEILDSSRTIKSSTQVILQAKVDVTEGDEIQVRWRVSGGEGILHHRILYLIRSN